MNLRDLEYLVALDEEGHFQRAAERCFVSQPTLSGQLKKLEEDLGVALVERSTRQVAMTEAGREVAAQARRVLAEARRVREVAAAFRDPLAGRLQVGVIPTVAPYLLRLFIGRLRERLPELRLFLHEHQTAVLLEKLRRAELDLLILALPVTGDELEHLELYREPFDLAVPAGHPLADRHEAALELLRGQELLLLEEGHCLRGQALEVCLLAGAGEYAGFRGSSLETLRQMVVEGIGLTLMPRLAIGAEEGIRYLRFAAPEPARTIGLVFRRHSPRRAAFSAIGETVAAAVAPALRA